MEAAFPVDRIRRAPSRRSGSGGVVWWQVVVAGAAVVAAVVAVWVTLEADFLAHPEWLAVQKADLGRSSRRS